MPGNIHHRAAITLLILALSGLGLALVTANLPSYAPAVPFSAFLFGTALFVAAAQQRWMATEKRLLGDDAPARTQRGSS